MPNGCAVILGMGLLVAGLTWIGGIYGFIGSLIIVAVNLFMFSGGWGD